MKGLLRGQRPRSGLSGGFLRKTHKGRGWRLCLRRSLPLWVLERGQAPLPCGESWHQSSTWQLPAVLLEGWATWLRQPWLCLLGRQDWSWGCEHPCPHLGLPPWKLGPCFLWEGHWGQLARRGLGWAGLAAWEGSCSELPAGREGQSPSCWGLGGGQRALQRVREACRGARTLHLATLEPSPRLQVGLCLAFSMQFSKVRLRGGLQPVPASLLCDSGQVARLC